MCFAAAERACERGAGGWSYAIECKREWLGVCSAHASMKQIRGKTFADATVSQAGIRVEDGLVNRNRRMCRLARLRYGCVDRKSTRLNSSHQIISYAVFCLKKKKE